MPYMPTPLQRYSELRNKYPDLMTMDEPAFMAAISSVLVRHRPSVSLQTSVLSHML